MSGICGWLGGPGGTGSADHVIAAMGECLTRFDVAPLKMNIGSGYGLAVAGHGTFAHLSTKDDCVAAIWGSMRRQDRRTVAPEPNPADTLIAAYREFGPEACRRFHGSAALALIDIRTGTALLATDRTGAHPITYRTLGDRVIFASNADALHRFPGLQPSIDWQSIYNYVHFHAVPGPATAFQAETRLMPGEYALCRAGAVETRRYWSAHYLEDDRASFNELKEEFLGVLRRSIDRNSHIAGTGAFLSGGTDSSTVAGMLGTVTGKPAPTFSIGFDSAGYDEMEYARIAARRYATAHHEYYVTPADIVSAVPRLSAIYDQPFGNSSAVPAYYCARLAKEKGVTHLLGGDGGDELFGGNERYATQRLFSVYEGIPSPLRRGLIEPIARLMPMSRALLPLRWFRRAVELAATPMPDRLDAYNLLLQFGPENVFSAELMEQIDRNKPAALMREAFHGSNAQSLINRMLTLDMRFTIADNDLPKVVRTCELAGLPVSFPLLDDEVMDFAAKLSPNMKLRGTKLRYFFKEALRGFLPDEIISKPKHGFGLPFGPWLKVHRPLEELVSDHLSDLKKRGIIRPALIDGLLADRIAEAPGYYGTMAWVLMMLEGWFKHHVQTSL